MDSYVSKAPETPRISPWGALVRVITEPKATFDALGEKPPIFPGYLVQMLAAGISVAVTLPLSMKLMDSMFAAQGFPAQAMAIGKWTGIIGGVIGALAGPWVIGVLLALLAMFFGQFMGSTVKFPEYLGMIGYARIPLAIHTVIASALAAQAQSIQEMADKSLSLAVFLPAGASPVTKTLLGALNPFDLWYFVLLAIGFASMHKARPAKGWGFAATVFALSLVMGLVGLNAARNVPGM